MINKFKDWNLYPESKPEKEGFYFVLCRDKDNITLSREETYYDGKNFLVEERLEVVAWRLESEAYRKENEVEDEKRQIIKAIKVIRETCLKNSCETCPFRMLEIAVFWRRFHKNGRLQKNKCGEL